MVMFNIRILNLSPSATQSVPYFMDPLNRAVEKAWQVDIGVAAAAGNEGPAAETISVPGNDPYVITVGAVNDMLPDSSANVDMNLTADLAAGWGYLDETGLPTLDDEQLSKHYLRQVRNLSSDDGQYHLYYVQNADGCRVVLGLSDENSKQWLQPEQQPEGTTWTSGRLIWSGSSELLWEDGGLSWNSNALFDGSGKMIWSGGVLVWSGNELFDASGKLIWSGGDLFDATGKLIWSGGHLFDTASVQIWLGGDLFNATGKLIWSGGTMVWSGNTDNWAASKMIRSGSLDWMNSLDEVCKPAAGWTGSERASWRHHSHLVTT